MLNLLAVVAQTALLALLAPAVVGYVRLAKARLQGRRGADMLQPYRELRKTFGKGMVIADTASWIFPAVPYVLFSSTLLAGLLETGRTLDGLAVTKILLRREAFRGRLNALFCDVDLLIMPVMNVAAPTLADSMAPAWRTPAAGEARIRFTAPFNMSGHPTLTLPGGKTADGLPVGFQIVGRHMGEALILRAGHAFQQVTDWHRRRPLID